MKFLTNDKNRKRQIVSKVARKDKKARIEKKTAIEYDVDKIVGASFKNGRWLYKVRWVGYSEDDDTWEPINHLENSLKMLSSFYKSYGGQFNKDEVPKEIDRLKEIAGESEFEAYDDSLSLAGLTLNELVEPNLNKIEEKVEKDLTYLAICATLMKHPEVPSDPEVILLAENKAKVALIIKKRREQLMAFRKKESEILEVDGTPINIENSEDLDHLDFSLYIRDNLTSKDIKITLDPPEYCHCNPCSGKNEKGCCRFTDMPNKKLAYKQNGRLQTIEKISIFECNRNCFCPPNCFKRVVQRGRQIPLTIFKTPRCGWGVKSPKLIPIGAFICEYVGEMITLAESSVREERYIKQNLAYIFDLDAEGDAEVEYCIDATHYGNVARFINHGCDPNALVLPVWVDNLHPKMHRLGIFAKKQIKAGEEIVFDYGVTKGSSNPATKPCFCGSAKCRGYVFR